MGVRKDLRAPWAPANPFKTAPSAAAEGDVFFDRLRASAPEAPPPCIRPWAILKIM